MASQAKNEKSRLHSGVMPLGDVMDVTRSKTTQNWDRGLMKKMKPQTLAAAIKEDVEWGLK